MQRVLLVAVAGSLFVTAGATTAQAKCASPRVVFAPADGARVPRAPLVHVILPSYLADRRVTVLGDGQEIGFWFDRATRDTGADVVAVSVRADDGPWSRVTVRVDGVEGAEASYVIDRGWRARSRDAVKLARVSRERSRWTCSHTDAFLLEVDGGGAEAYRIEWATSVDAFSAGTQAVQVVPRHRDDFWGVAPRKGPGAIGLGHLSCLGQTIPASALAGPLYVRVSGILADGSSTAPWAAPVLLTEAEPEAVSDPESVSGAVSDPEPVSGAVSDPDQDPDRDLHVAAALVALFAVVIFAFHLRARRSRLVRNAPPPR